MATISQLNIGGTAYDIKDNITLKITDAQWQNINGVSIHKYEGQNTSTYNLPTSYAVVASATHGGNALRGIALAADWRDNYYGVWINKLHNDSGAYNWNGWHHLNYMPNYSGGISMGFPTQPLGGTNYTYTCPDDGWICIIADRGSSSGYTLQIWIGSTMVWYAPAHFAYYNGSCFLPVSKGDVVTAKTDISAGSVSWNIRQATFYPCRG